MEDSNSLTCLLRDVIVIFCMPYIILPMFLLSKGILDLARSVARIRTILRTGGMSALRPCD